MALFRNICVNLRVCLCGVYSYASAQPLDFLDLAKNCSFLNWKLSSVYNLFLDGRYLSSKLFRGQERCHFKQFRTHSKPYGPCLINPDDFTAYVFESLKRVLMGKAEEVVLP